MRTTAALILSTFVLLYADTAQADTFGTGAKTFAIEFASIGDSGNAADTTGDPNPAGAVDYAYNIGKFEISRDMVEKANAEGGLDITLELGPINTTPLPEMAAGGVSWNEASVQFQHH